MEGWKRGMMILIVMMVIAGGGILIWRHGGGKKIEAVKVRKGGENVLVGGSISRKPVSTEREDRGKEKRGGGQERSTLHRPEESKGEAKEENSAIPQEVKEKVIQLVSNIYKCKQQIEVLTDRAQRLIDESLAHGLNEKEFAKVMNKKGDISREATKYAMKLKKLLPDEVTIIRIRYFNEWADLYQVNYQISIKREVEKLIPELKGYLPLTLVTAIVPEDESLKPSDVVKRIRERKRRGELEGVEDIPDFEREEVK